MATSYLGGDLGGDLGGNLGGDLGGRSYSRSCYFWKWNNNAENIAFNELYFQTIIPQPSLTPFVTKKSKK